MQPKYLEVKAKVRYWEDATLEDGSIPCRQGDYWCPIIDLDTRVITNWEQGKSAHVHYKVCDGGEYWLLDETKSRIYKWDGYYVPCKYLNQDDGNSDYIVLQISADGKIEDWETPFFCEGEWNKVTKIYRHTKRGGLYRLVCMGLLEVNKKPHVIYQSLEDGQVWIRPRDEFFDGRFEFEREEIEEGN